MLPNSCGMGSSPASWPHCCTRSCKVPEGLSWPLMSRGCFITGEDRGSGQVLLWRRGSGIGGAECPCRRSCVSHIVLCI